MRIAVLALQGAFFEHIAMLNKLGVDSIEIRQKSDFSKGFDGIILPGGESTTMNKLLHDLKLFAPLQDSIKAGIPCFGTCAGLILMSKRFEDSRWQHLDVLDVTVKRHGFGRQIGSFSVNDSFAGSTVPMVFIRGPYITEVGENVKILAKTGGKIVSVRQNNLLGTAFHPELTEDSTVHTYFLDMINARCE
ncbi:MAG: pyridoxal 5'-phosphate synthase glutaminase subunit PdxT [Defluviitaleaceae bacterium]|nr:pyridoxal 5'-phosphate synthase glutaminase subunit PdxT [Defluviitaleaceae bacterium]